MKMDFPPMIKKQSSYSNKQINLFTNNKKNGDPSLINQQKDKEKCQNHIFKNKKIYQTSRNSHKKFIKKFSFQEKYNNQQVQNINGSCQTISSQRQKTVPKSKSTNFIISKLKDESKHKKATKIIPKNLLQHELKLYEWRMSTHFPVIKVDCVNKKQINKQPNKQQNIQLQLQIPQQQNILLIWSQIYQFSLLNSIYIINESLVSFQRLFNKFGYFQPTIKMIFITCGYKCKIWLNQDIWQNKPIRPKFTSKQNQKVQNFYKRVVNIFSTYFKKRIQNQSDIGKRSINLIQKLIYQLQRKKDFVQALKFINQFLHAYSLKLNNKFIYPVQPFSNRSRIFSRLSGTKHQIKLNTLSHIPIPKSQEEKNIKTLKNSTAVYNQIKQSSCKTIDKSSQFFKLNQIQFKRKSQISICSKQTVPDKRQRFSVHDDKNSHFNKNKSIINNLPVFAEQDFNQNFEEDQNIIEPAEQKMIQAPPFFKLKKVSDDDEIEQNIRNQIQKNVRQKNGWLQNPFLLLQGDDCAKSFQDSQPSVKIRARDRSLSKLNRIKKSIANSIVQGNNYNY